MKLAPLPELLSIFELTFATVLSTAVFSREKRTHFSRRVALGVLSMALSALLIVGANQIRLEPADVGWVLVTVIVAATLICGPLFLMGDSTTPSPGFGDDDSDGPSGMDDPPVSPGPPSGDLPLPDADPSRVRVRDHRTPAPPHRPRRRTHEPQRRPVRAPPHR